MKAKFTLLAVLVAAFFAASAQQPTNGGFETWTNPKAPDGWVTLDSIISLLGHSGTADKDTADKFAGTASIKLVNTYLAAAQDTVPGIVAIGSGFFTGTQPVWYGTPFTSKPDTLFFAYKYAPVGGDTAALQIALSKAGSPGYSLGVFVGLDNTNGTWVNSYLPLRQYYTDTLSGVDTLQLQFSSTLHGSPGTITRVGSTLHVDAVRLGYKTTPTFIEEINNNLYVKVFPNPTTDLVNIQVSEVVNNASIAVYDMNGRIVTHEFGGNQNFELVTSNWESGVYTYAILSAGTIVNKGRFSVQH